MQSTVVAGLYRGLSEDHWPLAFSRCAGGGEVGG